MNGAYGPAFLLTSIAGLATGLGSLIGIIFRPGPRFMSATLGFAAGIMILIAFGELLPGAVAHLGFIVAHAAFFAGMVLMFAIDVAVPHVYMAEREKEEAGPDIRRISTLLIVGISIHNFPEGMATFAATLEDVKLGIALAAAIAIHNIPEGIVVSAPVYAARGSRGQAFLISLLSGFAEPVGAGIAALVLLPILTERVLAAALAGVAGLMVFISLDELVPTSKKYGFDHTAIVSAMVGMAVMAASLGMLR